MSSPQPEYRLAYHGIVGKQLSECLKALHAAGWEKEMLVSILKEAESRLKRDPSSCGEPIFNIRALDMVVWVFYVRPFSIRFGLQEKTRTVLVRGISLMTLTEI